MKKKHQETFFFKKRRLRSRKLPRGEMSHKCFMTWWFFFHHLERTVNGSINHPAANLHCPTDGANEANNSKSFKEPNNCFLAWQFFFHHLKRAVNGSINYPLDNIHCWTDGTNEAKNSKSFKELRSLVAGMLSRWNVPTGAQKSIDVLELFQAHETMSLSH